ncbi:putative F-box domain-containing protein [Helianthus anomalus]
MAELALDVVKQILVQLDVGDLIRCKSVCKSWRSLISSPPFVKLLTRMIVTIVNLDTEGSVFPEFVVKTIGFYWTAFILLVLVMACYVFPLEVLSL